MFHIQDVKGGMGYLMDDCSRRLPLAHALTKRNALLRLVVIPVRIREMLKFNWDR